MEQIIDTDASSQGCVPTNTPQADLEQLPAAIKKAHAQVGTALSDAIQHGITAGSELTKAKALLPHGGWGPFLRRCDLGERQSARYMQLYNLWMANPSRRDEFSGASIEGTIKKFAPAKPHQEPSVRRRPQKQDGRSTATALDILGLWDRASLTERTRFLRNVGLKPLALALPEGWLRSIERYLRESVATLTPATDLTRSSTEYPAMPSFLRRAAPFLPAAEEPRNIHAGSMIVDPDVIQEARS
jgi:hypothetical protein